MTNHAGLVKGTLLRARERFEVRVLPSFTLSCLGLVLSWNVSHSACHKVVFDATMSVRVTKATNTVYVCVYYMMGVHSITVTMLEWSRSQMGLLQRNRNGYIIRK